MVGGVTLPAREYAICPFGLGQSSRRQQNGSSAPIGIVDNTETPTLSLKEQYNTV